MFLVFAANNHYLTISFDYSAFIAHWLN